VKTNAKRGAFVENVWLENIRGVLAGQAVFETEMYYDGNPNKELTKKGGQTWPTRINNIKIVKQLATAGNIVVTVGGGGIPVVEENDTVRGVEAVIDKDLASALCAVEIGADEFYILTDVPKVYINFRKENEQALDTITVAEAKKFLDEGQFAEGSMAPKVRAAIMFVEHGGKECIITEAGQLDNPNCGTRIVR
jgi:carbamate kinase